MSISYSAALLAIGVSLIAGGGQASGQSEPAAEAGGTVLVTCRISQSCDELEAYATRSHADCPVSFVVDAALSDADIVVDSSAFRSRRNMLRASDVRVARTELGNICSGLARDR